MCIRDRVTDVLDTLHDRGYGNGLGMALHPDFPNTPVIMAAVSYTHLRAHETVLDLVCRLLLEKKKNIERIWQP